MLVANERALTAQTRLLSFACNVRGESTTVVDGEEEEDDDETMVVYKRDPSIMEIMNEANMYPRGREGWIACSWWEGTQRKTKRYIEPSKHV